MIHPLKLREGIPEGYLTARQIARNLGVSTRAVHYRANRRGIAGLPVLLCEPGNGRPPERLRIYAYRDVPCLAARIPPLRKPPPPPRPPKPTLQELCDQERKAHWPVVETVARCYEMTPEQLLAESKYPLPVEARRVAMRLLSERGLGAVAIGRLMHRDHSTILYHLAMIRDMPTEEEQDMLAECRKAAQQIGLGS